MSLYGGVNIVGQPDLENVRRLDLLAIPPTMAMMRYGIAVDREWLYELTSELDKELAELKVEICSHIPPEKLDEFIERSGMDAEDDYLPMNVESNQQMRRLLFDVLGVGSGHRLKLTKSGDISTGKRQLETRKGDHAVVPKVLKYREYSKLRGTYTAKLPQMAVYHPRTRKGRCQVCDLIHLEDSWRIHTEIMWTRTSTGRAASKNPNLQNIPIRSEYGRRTRKAFMATPGTEIVGVDFSQLQLRILADRAQEPRLIWIFENNKDPHTMTAAWTFEVPEDQVDPLTQRAPSKNVNFALVFGETPRGLYEQLVSDSYGKSGIEVPDWLTESWCEEFFRKWHGIYRAVGPFMEKQYYRARRYGCTWDMFGRVRRIPEVRSVHSRVIAAGLRQAGNHPIQAPDSGFMRLAMAVAWYEVKPVFDAAGIWFWPLMTIHDELLTEVEEGYGEIAKAYLVDAFENVLTDRETGERLLRVPVKADGKVMARWGK